MSRTIHLIHGIRTKDPYRTIGKLRPYFERAGFVVNVHDYGYMLALFQSRFANEGIAERIAEQVMPWDVVVGHSNGGDVIRRAINKGASPVGAVLINPALDDDTKFGPGVDWVHVYHNRGDSAVALARFLLRHPWGDMGRDGYRGTDPRVRNIDCWPSVDGHSEIFSQLGEWGPYMVQRVQAALQPHEQRREAVARVDPSPVADNV